MKVSRGSCTGDFIKENFLGRRFSDTVLVISNPYLNLALKDTFYRLIPVWKHALDNNFNTVSPQSVVEYARKAAERYPEKRLIIWFMQPHFPLIEDRKLASGKNFPTGLGCDIWQYADRGQIDIDDVWAAYKRNAQIVIPHALKLAQELKGRTVITADHGNAYRRLRFPPIKIVGHPPGVLIPELVNVPWHVTESAEKKKTVKGRAERDRLKARIRGMKKDKILRVS
jgi:hypothetical protein